MNKTKENSEGAFDCLRLFAALAVLFSHSYVLVGQGKTEPLYVLTHDKINISETAVYIFFAISGYLITQSWLRDPSVRRFLIRRLLRILPALAVVLLASVFVIGPLMTNLSITEYFSQRETWTYLTKIFLYPAQLGLPGVFNNNPEPSVINGSLWTLRAEFTLYLIIAVMGSMGCLRKAWGCIAMAILCIGAQVGLIASEASSKAPVIHHMAIMSANALPFFIGTTLAISKLSLRTIAIASCIFVILTVLMYETMAFKISYLITLSLVTLLIARLGRCSLKKFGDISYGVYVWAFVLQQMTVALMPNVTVIQLFATAGSAALCIGAASWHFVEKQALKFKPSKAI